MESISRAFIKYKALNCKIRNKNSSYDLRALNQDIEWKGEILDRFRMPVDAWLEFVRLNALMGAINHTDMPNTNRERPAEIYTHKCETHLCENKCVYP